MSSEGSAGSPRASRRWLPVAAWLPAYRASRLPGDVLAGAVVAALAVPQALGYAGIAGVPVQVGLYAIPLALVAYAVLGSSPHLVVGPVSTVSVLSGSLVAGFAHGNVTQAVALTSALAIAAGIGLAIGGIARVGWAVEFLSRPIITGFVFGLVLLIVLGELPSLLGMPPESGDVVARVIGLLGHLGDAQLVTSLVGLVSLAVLFVGARFLPRVPWGLVVLVGSIALSSWLDLASQGVATVGRVPQGVPPLGLPGIDPSDIPPVIVGGLAIGLVALAEGMSAARIFAIRLDYRIDADQELLATGAANVAAGLSGGLGVGGSLSKTASAVRAGSSSQVTGLVASGFALLVLVMFTSSLTDLPRAALSAIVIQAVWGLLDLDALKRYVAVRRNDFLAAIAAMIGVLLLGPLYGLLFAIGQSLLGLVYRSSRVHVDVMGKVPGEKAAWGSAQRHPERRTIDGVLVLRLDVPLFWANATEVVTQVLEAVDEHPGTHSLLLDLEATSQLDTTSVDALDVLLAKLRARGVELYLVRVFQRARAVLRRSGFMDRLGAERMWHSISAGVRAAREVQAERAAVNEEEFGPLEPVAGDEQIVAAHPDEPLLPADAAEREKSQGKKKKR
ncbi:MAG TPA: SulP family inorganic anion transporter [Candidatus Nanopelagicales bacterium]|nr:SulP family inorganic anion transporter [Candidatus Nanopelagicales bacterium]